MTDEQESAEYLTGRLGPVTAEVAQRWFLAAVAEQTTAFADLSRNVGAVFNAAVEQLSGERPPFRRSALRSVQGVSNPDAETTAFLVVPCALAGLPDTRLLARLVPLAKALLEWAKEWPYLRTGWAIRQVLFTLACEAFGARNAGLEEPWRVGEVYGPTVGEPEPIRFEAPAWYPTPTGARLPRKDLRAAFERYLDEYEARQAKRYREGRGTFPEAKGGPAHFRWLVWRLEGDSLATIAKREGVSRAVVSRETNALADLLHLPVTFSQTTEK